VLAEHTRVDSEGRTVPAFNYDYAIHNYFEEKEQRDKAEEDEQQLETLSPVRLKFNINLREKDNYYKHHVFVSAPRLKTLR